MSTPDLNKVAEAAAIEKKQRKRKVVLPTESTEAPEFVGDESDAKQVYIEKQRQENEDLRTLAELRKRYAFWLFLLIATWLAGVLVVMFLSGSGNHWGGKNIEWFKLSDGVLIAFLGTTTINVLGLFYIVANWLFPKPGNGKAKDSAK